MARPIYAFAMEKTTALTSLHPVTVIVALLAVVTMVFSTVDIALTAAILAALALVVVLGGMPAARTFGVLAVVVPLCFFITLIQGFAQEGSALFTLRLGGDAFPFSREGALLGLAITLRVACLALAMTIFFAIVHPVRLANALTRLGMPFKYAYTTVLALRFLPLMLTELETIKNAQKARGYDIDRVNFAVRGLNVIPLMTPLIITAMRRAATIALAMDLRAFGAYPDRTFYVELRPPGTLDHTIIAASVALAAGFLGIAIWA